MLPSIILVLTGGLLFLIAYLLYFKEAYWLISGINLKSRDQVRQSYDLSGLTRHFGKMCALLGFILLVAGFTAWMESSFLLLLSLGSMFLIIPIFLLRSERYILVGKKSQRIVNIVVTVILAVIGIFVAVMLVTGSESPDVSIQNDRLTIESSYGTELPLSSIEQVDWINLDGRTLKKLNGFNAGSNRKGYFSVEGIGKANVYIQGKTDQAILIKGTDKIILISLDSERANEELMDFIMTAWKVMNKTDGNAI